MFAHCWGARVTLFDPIFIVYSLRPYVRQSIEQGTCHTKILSVYKLDYNQLCWPKWME